MTCEHCSAPFADERNPFIINHPRAPKKRFCSETCRKRAERERARARRKTNG